MEEDTTVVEEQPLNRRADDSREAEAKSLTEPFENLVDALIDAVVSLSDAVIGWQAIVSSVGLAILGGITFILVILALSSDRILGFVVNAKWYAIAANATAALISVVFLTLVGLVVRKVLIVRAIRKRIHAP